MGEITLVVAIIGGAVSIIVAYVTNNLNTKVVLADERATTAEKKLGKVEEALAAVDKKVEKVITLLGVAVDYASLLRETHPDPDPWPEELYPYAMRLTGAVRGCCPKAHLPTGLTKPDETEAPAPRTARGLPLTGAEASDAPNTRPAPPSTSTRMQTHKEN